MKSNCKNNFVTFSFQLYNQFIHTPLYPAVCIFFTPFFAAVYIVMQFIMQSGLYYTILFYHSSLNKKEIRPTFCRTYIPITNQCLVAKRRTLLSVRQLWTFRLYSFTTQVKNRKKISCSLYCRAVCIKRIFSDTQVPWFIV